MIRTPKYTDAAEMVALLGDAHTRSVYAGRLDFDEGEANRIICSAIQRHGFKSASGTWAQVACKDDRILGMIVGALQPVYLVHKQLCATDLFFVTAKGCPVRDAVALMDSFVQWGKAHPKVVEIQCGATGVMGSETAAAKILSRLGLEPFGSIHRMEVTR